MVFLVVWISQLVCSILDLLVFGLVLVVVASRERTNDPLVLLLLFLFFILCVVWFVAFILCLPSLRARAVKRLAGIVDADGSLMGREAVRVSVTSSFLDEAVSVRQVGDVICTF